MKKFRKQGTVQDLQRRRPSAREGVEEVTNEAMVEEVSAQVEGGEHEKR